MNDKVIIGILIAVGIIAVIAIPTLHTMLKAAPAAPPPQVQAQAPPSVAPPPPPPPPPPMPEPVQEPIVWQGTYEPPPKPVPQYLQRQQAKQGKGGQGKAAPAAADPNALTAESLVGSAWQVDSPYGPVTMELGPGGQAMAMHSMAGTIPATWHVAGNKVVASASFMGQSIKIDATIQGQTLVAPGQNIRRLR